MALLALRISHGGNRVRGMPHLPAARARRSLVGHIRALRPAPLQRKHGNEQRERFCSSRSTWVRRTVTANPHNTQITGLAPERFHTDRDRSRFFALSPFRTENRIPRSLSRGHAFPDLLQAPPIHLVHRSARTAARILKSNLVF